MDYQVGFWKRCDWRKNTRHYSCELKQDLFGCWIIVRRWGQVTAFEGQSLEQVCNRYEQGLEMFKAVAQRRAKRGYSYEIRLNTTNKV